MATLALKDCKELAIFRAFTENILFLEACKALTEFDRTHPERRILQKPSDKEVLRKCFTECRQAMAIAFPRGEKPDFTKESSLNRLKNVFNQQLPSACRKSYDDFCSPISGQIGMGRIFSEHIEYIKRAGLSYYNQLNSEQKRKDEKRIHEQATVNSYRRLGHGYGNKKVFSGKTTYKTEREVVLAQMFGGGNGR